MYAHVMIDALLNPTLPILGLKLTTKLLEQGRCCMYIKVAGVNNMEEVKRGNERRKKSSPAARAPMTGARVSWTG